MIPSLVLITSLLRGSGSHPWMFHQETGLPCRVRKSCEFRCKKLLPPAQLFIFFAIIAYVACWGASKSCSLNDVQEKNPFSSEFSLPGERSAEGALLLLQPPAVQLLPLPGHLPLPPLLSPPISPPLSLPVPLPHLPLSLPPPSDQSLDKSDCCHREWTLPENYITII